MKLSLVICTYNRVDILKTTLPELAHLIVPSAAQLEIIIVDNNSNDDTADYLKQYLQSLDSVVPHHYVFEKKQGISHARNAGFKKAVGDYIAYIDDECLLPGNWIEVAVKTLHKHTPAFLGGPYFGKFLPGSSSPWFKESFGDSFLLQYKPEYGPLMGRYLSGGNMLIRRDVFEKIGLFDTELGMKGDVIAYGEEQDFQRRYLAQFNHEEVFYNPDLFVWHYIRNEKLSMRFLFKDALLRGQYVEKQKPKSLLKLLTSPLMLLFTSLRAISFMLVWFAVSLLKREHFFTLLHHDYRKNTWRSIGQSWYHFSRLFSPFANLVTR